MTAAASGAGTAIHQKTLGLGTTTLINSNDKIENIMNIVNSLEEFDLLVKGVSEIENEKTSKTVDVFLVCYRYILC